MVRASLCQAYQAPPTQRHRVQSSGQLIATTEYTCQLPARLTPVFPNYSAPVPSTNEHILCCIEQERGRVRAEERTRLQLSLTTTATSHFDMATKRKLDSVSPEEDDPIDPSDELMFTALGGGNEVGRSCHIIQYKGKTVMVCGLTTENERSR